MDLVLTQTYDNYEVFRRFQEVEAIGALLPVVSHQGLQDLRNHIEGNIKAYEIKILLKIKLMYQKS